jgi:hypothetical protein
MGANSAKTFAAPSGIGGAQSNGVSAAQGPTASPLLPGTALSAPTPMQPAQAATPMQPIAPLPKLGGAIGSTSLGTGQAPPPAMGQTPLNPYGAGRGGPAGGLLPQYRKSLLAPGAPDPSKAFFGGG